MATLTDAQLRGLLTKSSYNGLPQDQAQSVLLNLYRKLQSGTGNGTQHLADITDMFGADVGQQIAASFTPSTPIPSAPPTPSTSPTPTPSTPTSSSTPEPQALPSAPITTTNPAGGFSPGDNPKYGDINGDTARIIAEAELQKQLAGETLLSQSNARKNYLTDLGKLLEEQQTRQLSSELPGIYEDLNTRGLLRSSDLGNQLSRRQQELAAITSAKLAEQGLAYNDEYTSGLGNIENTYLGARNSALSRRFSLEDLDTNIKASKELGFALQPQPQSNGKGSMGLLGASTGASIGSAFGPAGTAIGGALGGVFGSAR